MSEGGGDSQDHPEVLSRLGRLMPLSSKTCPSIFWSVTKSPVFISLSSSFIPHTSKAWALGLPFTFNTYLLVFLQSLLKRPHRHTCKNTQQDDVTGKNWLNAHTNPFSFPVCVGRLLFQTPLQLGWEHVTELQMMKCEWMCFHNALRRGC